MVHTYCQIRDSWTGWVRGRAMRNTIQRTVSELRALQQAEERVVNKPSVAVLDYAARARKAEPRYTSPRELRRNLAEVARHFGILEHVVRGDYLAERQRRLRAWWAESPSAPLLDVPLALRVDMRHTLLRQLTHEGVDPLTGARELREPRALDGLGLPLAVEALLLAALDYRPHRFTVQLDWHEDEDRHDPPSAQPVALGSSLSATTKAKARPPSTNGGTLPRS